MSNQASVDNITSIPPNNHLGARVCSHCKAFFKQLISRKPMSEIQNEIDIRNKLARPLNWIHLLAIGIGCTIGQFHQSDHHKHTHYYPLLFRYGNICAQRTSSFKIFWSIGDCFFHHQWHYSSPSCFVVLRTCNADAIIGCHLYIHVCRLVTFTLLPKQIPSHILSSIISALGGTVN
jgi:hypothetical protein